MRVRSVLGVGALLCAWMNVAVLSTAEQPCFTSSAPLNTNAASDAGTDTNIWLATDGAGVWIGAWASWDTLGGTIGGDQDILFSRSLDNGWTWSAPQPLNINAATDSGDDHWPRLATNGSGKWVATWTSNDTRGGTLGTDWDLLVSRSSDNGATWSTPAPLNTDAATDPVSPYPRDDWWPDLATDANGVWVASWSSVLSLGSTWSIQTRVARSTDNGATWSTPVAVGAVSAYDQLYSAIATDKLGNWAVLWRSPATLGGTIGSDLDILFSRSTDNGLNWSAQAALNTNAATDSGADRDPSIATDGSTWIASWRSNDTLGGTKGADDDILVSRSTNGGQNWTAPQVLTTRMGSDASGDMYPRLAPGEAGKWLAVFESTDSLGGQIGTDTDVLYAVSTDGGLTWPDEGNIGSHAFSDTAYDGIAHVATDKLGHWVIAWHSSATLGGAIGGDFDILTAANPCTIPTSTPTPTLTPLPTESLSPTATPTESLSPTTSPTETASLSPSPSLTPTATPTATPSASLTASLTFTPSPTESPVPLAWCFDNEFPLNTNADGDVGADTNPWIATDKNGMWIAVWASTDSLGGTIGGDQDILFARSTDAGHTWSAPRALNSNAATDAGADHWPRIQTDGAGRWVAIWRSNDTLGGTLGQDFDILVARSTDNGATWTSPAPLNSDASTDQVTPYAHDDVWPDLATNGQGTWVATWTSILSLGYTWSIQPRVSRSTNNGATWSTPVSLESFSTYDELFTAVAADDAGNWVATWRGPGKTGSDLDIRFSRSANNGSSWSAAASLNTNASVDTGIDRDAAIAFGGGAWIAAWRSTDTLGGLKGSDADIVFARSTDAGASWSSPKPLTSRMAADAAGDSYPRLATDGAGHWLAVFESTDSLSGLIGTDSDVFYAGSSDGGQTWPQEEVLNSNAAADAHYDGIANAFADGQGNWIAAWHSLDTLGNTIGTDFDILTATAPCIVPTSTPTPTTTPTATETPEATPTPGPTDTPEPTESVSPSPSPTSVPVCPQGPIVADLRGFRVEFLGAVYDPVSNSTTFTYELTGLEAPPALSHWVLGLGSCPVLSASPSPFVLGRDPKSGITGIKWEQSLEPDESRVCTVTVGGNAAVGTVDIAVKAGPKFEGGPFAGPRCDCAEPDPAAPAGPAPVAEMREGADFAEGGDLAGAWAGGAVDLLAPPAAPGLKTANGAEALVNESGLCMAVPAEGDQLVAWYADESRIPLVDGSVYRVTFDVTTDQSAEGAIPLLDMWYDNFADGRGPAFGGSSWFLDVAGGAEGIGRAQGRSSFTVYLAPAAAQAPQWRGLLGNEGAFSPANDPWNDIRIGFRLLDIGSGGYNANADSGQVCVGGVRVEAFNIGDLPAEATLFDAAISTGTHAAFANGQAPQFAQIDNAAGKAVYQLGTVIDRATLLPAIDLDPPGGVYDTASLYPVVWESNTLYRLTASIQLAENASGDSQLDAIFVNADTPTVEIGTMNFAVRGATGYFNRSGAPRKASDAGGAQPYVAYFYGQNASLLPGAARLRPLVDLFNTTDLNGIGSGGDPLEVVGLRVERLREP